MKNRLISFVAVLMLLGVLGKFYAQPLLAQVRAALVQNIDEPGRAPFSAFVKCPGASCDSLGDQDKFIKLQPVVSAKRLVITNVTGRVLVDTPGVLEPIILTPVFDNTVGTLVHIPTLLQSGVFFGGENIIGVNASVLAFYDQGATPAVEISATTAIRTVFLNLSGYLVDCNASCAAPVIQQF